MIRQRIERAGWARRAWARLRSPRVRWPVGVLAVLGYVLVSLWPFSWHPPERVPNGAYIDDGAGLLFPAPGLVRSPEPPAWLETARRTGQLHIALRVWPLLTRQGGPARIFSVAGNGFERNLLIGQEGDDLVVQLRTPLLGANGTARDAERTVRVRDVFVAGHPVDVALIVTPGELTLRVGKERHVQRELSPDPLQTWNGTYRLAFGNETTGSYPWLGQIEQAIVRTPDAVYRYPGAAPLERPSSFWMMSREPKLQPLRHLEARDAVNNMLLYLPLGLFFAVSALAGTRYAALRALLLIAGLSAGMELAQLFISVRNPLINDLILNVAGGGVGYAAGRGFARWAERTWGAGHNLTATRSR